jgi:hypothetical protein
MTFRGTVFSCIAAALFVGPGHAAASDVGDPPHLKGLIVRNAEDPFCNTDSYEVWHTKIRACSYGFEAKQNETVDPTAYYDIKWMQMRITPTEGYCLRKANFSMKNSFRSRILGYAPKPSSRGSTRRTISLSIRERGGRRLGTVSQDIGRRAAPLTGQRIEGANRVPFSWENHHGLGSQPVDLAFGVAYSYEQHSFDIGEAVPSPFVSVRAKRCS